MLKWPLGMSVEASKEEQGLVDTVKILMSTKSQKERVSITERAVQKVFLLFKFEATEGE